MPISPIVLQRRHAELGRIRLGDKGDRGQPQKLSKFRFTSHSEAYVKDLAALYGGTAQPWDNAGVASWEVYTTATSIPVYVVKGGLSQWLEFWQGGGCVHRCDGENNVLTGEPCDLEEKVKTRVRGQDVWVNPHTEAKPTTRLSVMLPELDAIGVWRMESHGWNAAAEIPAVAELAQYVGDLVPAVLHLVERRAVKDGKTSRFVVPVLDLRIGQARLREIVASVSGGGELEAPTTARVLEAGTTENPYTEWATKVTEATDLDALGALWVEMRDGHELVGPDSTASAQRDVFVQAFKVRAAALKPAPAAESPAAGQPDAEGVYEGQTVDDPPAGDPDPDVVWQQVLKAGGERGMTLPDIEDDVVRFLSISSAEASGEELAMYLAELLKRDAA